MNKGRVAEEMRRRGISQGKRNYRRRLNEEKLLRNVQKRKMTVMTVTSVVNVGRTASMTSETDWMQRVKCGKWPHEIDPMCGKFRKACGRGKENGTETMKRHFAASLPHLGEGWPNFGLVS
jgi:hypothetical protein